MSIASEYWYLKPRVTWGERIKRFCLLVMLGYGVLVLLVMALAAVMFFAMFFLPSYEYLTDRSFLSPVLDRWLLIAVVPFMGISLRVRGPLLKRLWSAVGTGVILYCSLVMLVYSGSYMATQSRFRGARQSTYVFRIAGERSCGKSRCGELVWDGAATPDISIGASSAAAIRENANSHGVSDPMRSGHSRTITDYCIRLPVEVAGKAARIPLRKFHNFTTADFIACPADAEILRNWPPPRSAALPA